MAREQLGAAPSIAAHAATKTYVDSGTKTLTNTSITGGFLTNCPIVWSNGAVANFGNDSGGSINLGRNDNVASNPYIDFNSSSVTSDFDCRISASGGNGSVGQGQLTINANPLVVTSGNSGTIIRLNYYGTTVGSITTNGTGAFYTSASDYRLKENVTQLNGGIDTITALRPVKYQWKRDGSYGEGFLAHELQEVIPEAVVGEKDAVNEDGTVKPQGIDMARIIPHLVSAVQELTTRLEAAEARITQLEGQLNG